MLPLSKDIVIQCESYYEMFDKHHTIICDRITYVLKTWFKHSNVQLNNWWFSGDTEYDLGNVIHHMNNKYIVSIEVDCHASHHEEQFTFIDKNGEEFYWENLIPVRWLFEDFEEEIIKGKAKFAQKLLAEKTEKVSSQKEKDKKLTKIAKSIRQKLSAEELSDLKRFL